MYIEKGSFTWRDDGAGDCGKRRSVGSRYFLFQDLSSWLYALDLSRSAVRAARSMMTLHSLFCLDHCREPLRIPSYPVNSRISSMGLKSVWLK
jgi:hypothetical protein